MTLMGGGHQGADQHSKEYGRDHSDVRADVEKAKNERQTEQKFK